MRPHPVTSTTLFASACVLLGCPDRFDTVSDQGATSIASADDGSATGAAADATSGVSATSAGGTLPPAPQTSDGGTDDTGSATGGECVDGEVECAPGTEPLLFVCQGGSWARVPQSHRSGAGDCDGVCRDQTNGAFLASDCVGGECVCDRSCPASAKESGWEDGYCANGFTYWRCAAGEWTSIVCDDWCKYTCAAAQGSCEAGEYIGKNYYDTCVCDYSACGSCEGICGSTDAVPDGNAHCFCHDGCEVKGDCCHDYYDVCGAKAPPDGDEIEHIADGGGPEGSAVPLDVEVARATWPSLGAYPQVPDTLVAGLARTQPADRLAGVRDAFASPEWPTLRKWNRFGAIRVDGPVDFVSLAGDEMPRLDGVSLGCLGGFAEAARVLHAPTLSFETILGAPEGCPAADSASGPCEDGNHTGLHALLNLRAAHLPDWHLELVDPGGVSDLQRTFVPSPDPYHVSASHVGRRDGERRYHHMMVVLVDADASTAGPLVFDTTGRRGVSLRRVTWSGLASYFGTVLAGGSRAPYRPATKRIAVLHSGVTADR